jgi:hypothetical protein
VGRTTMAADYDSYLTILLLIGMAVYLGGTLALTALLGRV